ncbi:hypothetical protein B0H14DRAFT_2632455 [Mycena olivaceomarginata]|nr:hypothetical protein B0H14DRAFT_2632455 [Mycena olivaceomarginata]
MANDNFFSPLGPRKRTATSVLVWTAPLNSMRILSSLLVHYYFSSLPTAEFYSTAANVQGVVDDAIGAASMPTDFKTNSLALRKRMYHIMVELAVIHEQLCSHLTRRSQLAEEGETIKDLLSNLPESAALGVDSMVP